MSLRNEGTRAAPQQSEYQTNSHPSGGIAQSSPRVNCLGRSRIVFAGVAAVLGAAGILYKAEEIERAVKRLSNGGTTEIIRSGKSHDADSPSIILQRSPDGSEPDVGQIIRLLKKGRLGEMVNVARLEFRNLQSFTDERVKSILEKCDRIGVLAIDNCKGIRGECLSALPDQVDAVSISLSGSDIEPIHLAKLARITGPDGEVINPGRAVYVLKVDSPNLTDAALRSIGEIPALWQVHFKGPFTAKGLGLLHQSTLNLMTAESTGPALDLDEWHNTRATVDSWLATYGKNSHVVFTGYVEPLAAQKLVGDSAIEQPVLLGFTASCTSN